MIKYNWKITGLKKAPKLGELSNVVTEINFLYTGTDENGITGYFNSSCSIKSPSSESFKLITDLTEEEVIGWAKKNHEIYYMRESINEQIKNKITPTNEDVTEVSWLLREDIQP